MSRDGMSGSGKSNWWDRIAPFSHDQCQERYEALEAECDRLKTALEYYAHEKHIGAQRNESDVFPWYKRHDSEGPTYIEHGARARAALRGETLS